MANWERITESELRLLLADNVLRLDADMFPRWEELGVMPVQIQCERPTFSSDPVAQESLFVVARAEDEVLIYDDVEDAFGIGRVDADGVLRNWGTYGEELSWALRRFPSDITEPPA